MSVRRVSPHEAQSLVEQGWAFVDVRSEQEFAAGRPAGSVNVPIAFLRAGGMVPNPDFVATMERMFAKDARVVVTCKSGGRSLRAAELLAASGFTSVVDQRAGFDGGGEPGWRALGLPIASGPA